MFSLPGRQLFVMTRFPAAANYIKLTTSLCYSLIEPFLLLFIFGAPCFLSLLVYSFFFQLSLHHFVQAEMLVYEKMIVE